jgi:hypothetical protein
MLMLLKYSTHLCQTCQEMARFDARVARKLGVAFVDVNMKAPAIYGRYRRILLQQYPTKRELSLPTYLLVNNPEQNFEICGEINGGMGEKAFQVQLQRLLTHNRPPEA